MKDAAHTIMEEEINKEANREFSQNTKSIDVLLWKFNQKRLKNRTKNVLKKTIMKNCIEKQIFKKTKTKINLKNMPDCGR